MQNTQIKTDTANMTTELVTLNDNSVPTTDSLKVAKCFGKRHDNVMRDIRTLIDGGVLSFEESSYTDTQNKSQRMFTMTRQAWMILVMGFNGPKALKFKKGFVDAFDKMEEALKSNPKGLSLIEIPQTFAEALMLAGRQAEQIEEDRPKVEAYDDFLATDNLTNLTTGLQSIGLRPRKTIKWMKGRYLWENSRFNRPYQKFIEQDLLTLRAAYSEESDSWDDFLHMQTLFTSKGIAYFEKKKLNGELPIDLLAHSPKKITVTT